MLRSTMCIRTSAPVYRPLKRAHQCSIVALVVLSLIWSFTAIGVVIVCIHNELDMNSPAVDLVTAEEVQHHHHIMQLDSTLLEETPSALVLNVSGAVEVFAALKAIARDNDDCVTRAHVVNIERGHVRLYRTIKLEAHHGGTAQFPTVIQGGAEAESVQFSGGEPIDDECFQKVTERSGLNEIFLSQLSPAARRCGLYADLPKCLKKNVNMFDFSSAVATGATETVIPIQPHLHSLNANWHFSNEWHLSRFPNKRNYMNQWTFIHNVTVNDTQHFSFQYDNETATHIQQWNMSTSSHDIWMRGFWQYDSLDQTIAIDSIDTNTNRIYAKTPSYFGVRTNARIYYENILAELDAPYEYYIDQETGYLFIIPPKCGVLNNNNINNKLVLSQLSHTMIYIKNTQHIILRNFTLQSSRGSGIVIHNSSHITIDHLHIRHVGNVGIICGTGIYYTQHLRNLSLYSNKLLQYENPVGNIFTDFIGREWWDRRCGSNNIITQSLIHHCGAGAIIIGGGNRKNLIHGHNMISDNTIHDYATLWRTSHAAITVDGVGQTISHNRIYNGAHSAIVLYGNDHEVHHNEISHIGRETSDVAAVYSGRDWTQRNYHIHHNLIHTLMSEYDLIADQHHYTRINRSEYCHENNSGEADCYEAYGALLIAINMDDLSSAHRIDHNVIIGVPRGISIGGGREINVVKNILIDVDVPIHIDARGVNLFRSKAKVVATVNKKLQTTSNKMNSTIWYQRYPSLRFSWNMTAPIANFVSGNVMIASGPCKVAPAAAAVSIVMNDSSTYILTPTQINRFRTNEWTRLFEDIFSSSCIDVQVAAQQSILSLFQIELASIDRTANRVVPYIKTRASSIALWDDIEHLHWRRSALLRVAGTEISYDDFERTETVHSRLRSRAHCSVKEITGLTTTTILVNCHNKQAD